MVVLLYIKEAGRGRDNRDQTGTREKRSAGVVAFLGGEEWSLEHLINCQSNTFTLSLMLIVDTMTFLGDQI